MGMTCPALEFRDVTVRYEDELPTIIANVSFTLLPGERVALVGLNGSGKTTLLSAAVGLVRHDGEIRIAGERLNRKSVARARDRVGFVFNVPEDQLLFPRVLDDVSFGLLRRGVPAQDAAAKAKRALGTLGVEHLADSPLHHLSHGQKQRVALAGALATEPSLLLLDEPTAGLDPPGKRALSALLENIDAAMMIATHDLEFAARLCTRFLMLDQGRLAFDRNDPVEVKRRWEL
jgi:cobalt/nickel transport system ATP-binding protein